MRRNLSIKRKVIWSFSLFILAFEASAAAQEGDKGTAAGSGGPAIDAPSNLQGSLGQGTDSASGGQRSSGIQATSPSHSGTSTGDVEQLNLDSIKQKYWARGNETELGVVQNRTFSKKHKVEVSLLGGVAFSDPFLTIKTLGATVGYHFSEYFGVNLLGFKQYVSPSSALLTFQQTLGATTNTNNPNYYVGAEAVGSIFYGKLSVLGKAIIYYDFDLLAGVGMTNSVTSSGGFVTNYVTPSVGIGQRYYLSKNFSIRLDYRLQYYNEAIIEQQVVTELGQIDGYRANWTNLVTLGVGFMF